MADKDTLLEEEPKKGKLSRESFREATQVLKFIAPYKWYFIGGLILLVLGGSTFVFVPKIIGEMGNVATGESSWPLTLGQLGMLLGGLAVLQSMMSFVQILLFTKVSESGMADLRTAVFQKLITLPIPYYDERRVGEMTSRITNDVSTLSSLFSFTLAQFVRQLVTLIGSIIMIGLMSPKLSLIMLSTLPLIVLLVRFVGGRVRRLSKARQDVLAKSNVIVEENLHSIQIVKAFVNEFFEKNRYGGMVQNVVDASMKLAFARGGLVVIIFGMLFGSLFFVVYMGMVMVQNGGLSLGDFLAFAMYTMVVAGAIGSLGGIYEQVLTALGATERVREILNEPSEIDVIGAALTDDQRFQGVIEYENIEFTYPTRPDIEVLKGISLKIQEGKKVAFVGASGSGKSTLVRLLLRFYEPTGGQLLIDGKAATDYDLATYRQNMAIVPQEVILFGGTIRENILYGKPEATNEEVMEAAEKANAWEFISTFPEALETIVGERGVQLSGGQRQRIAIARAILRNPSILLLDEATSALDAESERVVQDALNVLMEGRTSIIIAHRLATIRDVDCIYVLDKGQVIEQGTHTELSLIEDGAYSNLARLQFDLNEV